MEKILKTIELTLIVVLVTYLLYRLYLLWQYVTYPYLNEFREGATMDITRLIMSGENPYTLKNAVAHLYVYGGVYSLLLAGLCKLNILSLPLLFIHRVVSFVFLLLSAGLVAREVYPGNKHYILPLIGFIMMLSTTVVAARPESLGIFVLLGVLAYSKKVDSAKKALVLAILTVLTFYIKQYFVIVYAPVVLSLLFKRKSVFITYLLSVPIIFLLTDVLVNYVFPAYFLSNVVHHLGMPPGTVSYAIFQFKVFIQEYWPLIVLGAIGVFIQINKLPTFKVNLSLKSDEPLFSTSVSLLQNVYFITAVVVTLLLYLKLGHSKGTYMTYFYQLLLPPLVIFVLHSVSQLITLLEKHSIIAVRFFGYGIIGIFLLTTLLLQHTLFKQSSHIFEAASLDNWVNADNFILQHSPKNAYLAPFFTDLSIEHDWQLYDNGQAQYVRTLGTARGVLKRLLPQSALIDAEVNTIQIDIDNKLRNRTFSSVVIAKRFHSQINDELLKANYHLEQTLTLNDINDKWEVEFWMPKEVK